MCKKYLKVFFGIAGTLTLVNWILGMLIVNDILPIGVILLANPPFGLVYIWTESLWTGEGYQIGEQIVGQLQIGAHIAQIFLYFGGWFVWDWYRQKSGRQTETDV